jgi:hypothetical protein
MFSIKSLWIELAIQASFAMKFMYAGRSQVGEKVVAQIFLFFPDVGWMAGTELGAGKETVPLMELGAGRELVAGMMKLASVPRLVASRD